MEFIARKSNYIQEDIKRGWSSWNFGEEGFNGTSEELMAAKNEAIESNSSFFISGFDLWEDDIDKADIRELYKNYWVLVDNFNACGELSCLDLNSDNLEDAINEAKDLIYTGDGQSFNPSDSNCKYEYSINNEIHIFSFE